MSYFLKGIKKKTLEANHLRRFLCLNLKIILDFLKITIYIRLQIQLFIYFWLMKNVNAILLCMMRKKRGNWEKTQEIIGHEIMTKFETAGYLSRIGNDWQINPQERAMAVRAMFSRSCF